MVARRISRVTTRSGDDGTTGIAGGARLSKADPRIEALGAVDELNCHLGTLFARVRDREARRWVDEAQQDLFDLGAVLARGKIAWNGEEKLARLDRGVREMNATLAPLEEFLLPGGGEAAALCHVARAVCRRAERRAVVLDDLPATARIYLNRLSDLLFVLARVLAREEGEPERSWRGASAPSGDAGVE